MAHGGLKDNPKIRLFGNLERELAIIIGLSFQELIAREIKHFDRSL